MCKSRESPLRTQLLLLVLLVAAASARPDLDSNRVDGEDSPSARRLVHVGDGDGAWSLVGDLRSAFALYSECGGGDEVAACLKVKLVAAMDRAARGLVGDVDVVDGVTLVREAGVDEPPLAALSEQQLAASLPRSLSDKEQALDSMIFDRIARFLRSHSVQFKMSALDDAQRSLSEQGRKKGGIGGGGGGKKGGLGLLLLPLMAFGSLVPLAFGALFLLAGKALLVSKIALLLSAILGLKKLFSHDHHHGHESTVVVSAGHDHHGRSLEGANPAPAPAMFDLQQLAYRGYVRQHHSQPALGAVSQ